jgi:hypothetical protein
MRRHSSYTAIFLLVSLMFSQEFEPFLWAQTSMPTPQQLDQLLAPIALYPDSLLAQITTASTNPQEILDVDNWLQQNSGLSGSALTDAAEKAGFDPAFIALTNFPQVVDMMAQNVDDYAAIGQAVATDQEAVSASIQRLRAQAYAAGSLRSNSQQQVEVQQPAGQTVYVIQPANPQVVYVPVYNPTVVYVQSRTTSVVATSLITFGMGVAIGALLVSNQPWGWGGWGWHWGSHRVYYNHTVWVRWGNPYHPPHPWYRPRPIHYSSRPGYHGNWHYRPPNYRPPVPGNRPGHRPPWGPNNRPGYNPPTHRPSGSRPPTHPASPSRPTHPIAKPGTTKPPTANKPSVRPPAQTKPSQPGTRPPASGTTRPAPKPQTKPASPSQPVQTRPAGQPKPTRPSPSQPQKQPSAGSKPAAKSQPAPQPR